mmetsp:Transcript_9462/g.16820  ORF Transcript_9462/g.16820 Transcript_9462/m.16820 type:complete len:95 (+) Transcript_9462:1101-1385(+)
MEESRDDNGKEGSFGAKEVHQDREKYAVAASALAAAGGEAATASSDSMEISEESPIKGRVLAATRQARIPKTRTPLANPNVSAHHHSEAPSRRE